MYPRKKLVYCLIFLSIAVVNSIAQEKKKPEFIIKFGTLAPTDTPWHQVMWRRKSSERNIKNKQNANRRRKNPAI